MKTKLFFLLCILFLFSCKKNDNSKTAAQPEYELKLPSATAISFPYTDSTNFDNFKEENILDSSQVNFLKLKEVNDQVQNFYLKYKIPFSQNFESYVISYEYGEHELFTTLINYDKKYNIVDKIDLSYDETAESQFRKSSTIWKDSIKIEDISYTEDQPKIESIVYKISHDGKIIKK